MAENEKQFESNIEAFLISPDGGYEKATDAGYTGYSYIGWVCKSNPANHVAAF